MERFHNRRWIYGTCGKPGKDSRVKGLRSPVDGRSTPARPCGLLRCLALDVDGGGCRRQRAELQVTHEWGAGACRGRPAGTRGEGGPGLLLEEASGPREQRRGGRQVLGRPSHRASAPAANQVSPMSPSKPIPPRWRTKCLCRREKPSRSFISSWTVGGSSGRRASLPTALPLCPPRGQPWPRGWSVWAPCLRANGTPVSHRLSLDSVSILI